MRVQIHSRRVWISQQDVQKPTVKPFVEVVAVEMCVELEGEQLREMLRRGNCRSLLKQLSKHLSRKKVVVSWAPRWACCRAWFAHAGRRGDRGKHAHDYHRGC